MRIGCLLVPDLPLRAELRAHPELRGEPLVVATGSDSRAEVIAVSYEAAAAGVHPWCSVAHARAVCGELQVRSASLALERAARETLLDIALSFSPRAEPVARSQGVFATEGAVFLDASGVTSLFHSEQGFAAAVGQRAEAHGLPAAVAVARSRSAAHLAARTTAQGETCVLEPGDESAFLSPLSVDLLEPDDKLAQALTRFGIRTVHDLLHLPRRALAQRLGPGLLTLVARARGEESQAQLATPSDKRLEEAIDLEYAVDRLEPTLFVLRGLLSRLAERLRLRGLAYGPLDLHLGLVGGGRDVRRVGIAAPTRDVRVLLRLIGLTLEAQPPGAAIESLSLATEGRPLRSDQLDLFRPRGPDPVALDRTLAELESLCGNGRVGAPEVANDHHPEAYALKPFQPGRAAAPTPPLTTSPVAVRNLRPPVAAQVRVERGRPAEILSAVATGSVVQVAGPWRTTGRWWSREERFAVDHFDVQVSDGTVLRLCFDWIGRRWKVDAIYD